MPKKVDIDYSKLSTEELLPLAEKGNTEAQVYLGVTYELGKGVSQDYQLAVKWYKRVAEQGHANAQYYLGGMYLSGQGVPQDYQLAVKWYRRSAQQGNAPAQLGLGFRYASGKGVPQDFVLAYKWMHLAAAQGFKIAGKGRDDLARNMITSQVQKAQRLAREFKPNKEKPKKESQ